ncbi:DUF3306 domain-containing protein [Paramagnetospirillum kuznetsovii]|uniref:DUF3306 domain-containing protein n=1 Tax=Paramagnetospirillum kuznetsovii TaxID=2053833 RepID=A0A364NZJ5_9PROT|nr:DUF3306 domain-containing protein [Paramagnetospirillum kuznetsovii]RAU22337.1 DUF3306 domain-containing protein [Paramagnetospirillum kuznetsovii]
MSEAFLERWSKRKREAKTAAVVADESPPTPTLPHQGGGSPAEPPEPPADLPSIDSLGAESDYSAFLKPGVPAALRGQALQKLWASNPSLMAPEVMDLHMGDYTSPAVAEVVKTAWRLGKGVLDATELAEEKLASNSEPTQQNPSDV